MPMPWLLLLCVFHIACGTTWFVDLDALDNQTCSQPSQPCSSIRLALGASQSGDTISLAPGIYQENELEMLKAVHLIGQPGNTTIDCSGGQWCLRVNCGGIVELQGIHFTVSEKHVVGVLSGVGA